MGQEGGATLLNPAPNSGLPQTGVTLTLKREGVTPVHIRVASWVEGSQSQPAPCRIYISAPVLTSLFVRGATSVWGGLVSLCGGWGCQLSRLTGVNEIVSTLAENGCEQSLRLLRVGGGTRTGGGRGGGGVRAGSVWNCVSKSVLSVWVGLVLGMLGGELQHDLPTCPWPGEGLLPTGLCWRSGNGACSPNTGVGG